MRPSAPPEQLRLQDARRLILTKSRDADATAFAVGYESPSRSIVGKYHRALTAADFEIVALVRKNGEQSWFGRS